MKPITNVLAAGLLLLAGQIFGQITTTIFPQSVQKNVNEIVDLELKVTNFTNIQTFQCPITYNPQILEYINSDGYGLPGMQPSDVNHPLLPAPRVTIAYLADFSQHPNGVTVPAGTTILVMHFKVKAGGTTSVNLSSSVNPAIEAGTADGNVVNVVFQNGGSTVVGVGGPPPPTPGFKIMVNGGSPVSIEQGATKCVPVTVNDFDNIISMQYAMTWNTSILQYVSTQDHTLPQMTTFPNNISINPSTNALVTAWSDPAATGVSKPDGAEIYKVCFKAIGAANTSTDVLVGSTGLPASAGSAEAIKAISQVLSEDVWKSDSGVKATVTVTQPVAPPNALTFHADTLSVFKDSTVCVPVRVRDFTDIVIAQVGFQYDNTKLEFKNFQFGTNPLNLSTGSSIVNLACGQIRMNYNDPATVGVDLPNNTVIFSPCFKAIGNAGQTVKLDFSSTMPNCPPNIPSFITEVYQQINNTPTEITPTFEDGHVYIKAIPPPPPCMVSVNVDNTVAVKCNNGSDGAINITSNGSTGATFAYSWSGPNSYTSTQADISGLKPGTYNLTVTATVNGTSCSTTASPVVLANPIALSLPTVNPNPVNCFGGNDGSIGISAAGGTGNLSYNWSGPTNYNSTNQNITVLKAGNYKVTITDANGCSLVSGDILVAQPQAIALPTAGILVTGPKCFGDSQGGIVIPVPTGGTAPYTFAWGGPNNFSATTQNISNLKAGAYTVTITDSKNCTFVAPAITVSGPTSAVTIAEDVSVKTNIKCFGEENGKAGLIVIGGTPGTSGYQYSWIKLGGGVVSTVQYPQNLGAGQYTVVVTDQNGCSATLINPAVEILGPPSALTAVVTGITNIKCFGDQTGSISLNVSGGWPGNTQVLWTGNHPGNPVTGLPAGNYAPTITDAGGCSINLLPQTISGPQTPIAFGNTTVTNVKCAGNGDGAIQTSVTGGTSPYQVVWNNGQSGLQISNLPGGNYTATVTDANNCTAVQPPIQVSEPSAPLDGSASMQNQNGGSPGSITLTMTGGTQPYNYVWSNGGSSNNVLTANAGTYTVTVTDANGCKFIRNYTIENDLIQIQASASASAASCNNNGCISVSVTPIPNANLKPYYIEWSGPAIGEKPTNDDVSQICDLPAGSYSVTVTAANNTSVVLSNVVIGSLPPVVVSFNIKNPNEDFANGCIDLTPVFPNSNYSYLWFDGTTADSICNLDQGSYCVTITDNNTSCSVVNCQNLVRVWQPLENNTIPEVVMPSCVDKDNGMIRVFIKGGKKPYSYKWSGPSAPTATDVDQISDLAAGFYNLTVTDANGTTKTYSWTLVPLSNISANALITPGPNGYDISGPDECDGEVKITATGHVPPLQFNWSNAGTSATNSTLCAGDWSCVVTDGAGCSVSLNGTLTAPEAVVFEVLLSDYNGSNVKCFGSCEGQAAVSVAGGVAPYKIKWSTGFQETLTTSNDVSTQNQLCAGEYTVTVTDDNKIETVKTITISQPDEMILDFDETLPKRFTECDGTVTILSNGVAPVNFTWTSKYQPNGIGAEIADICAGEKFNIIAIDANGCKVIGEYKMGYPDDGCLIVSPVLTPGQTADQNDVLFITCVESIPENTFEIYNRWGQLVFETKTYDNDSNSWDGTNSKGQPLPEGVYYYILTYESDKGEQLQVKGYVNLLR